MAHVTPIVKGMVARKVRYVTQYDGGIDQEDMVAELELHAVEVLRQYEVEGWDEERLVKTAVKSVKRRLANIAGAFGRPKRRPIALTQAREKVRQAWHFSRTKLLVRSVLFSSETESRRVTAKGNLKILVTFRATEKTAWVLADRLYSTRTEATEARSTFLIKGPTKRAAPLISFGEDSLDQFKTTTTSLDQPRGDGSISLLDLFSSPTDDLSITYNELLKRLQTASTPNLPTFAKLVVTPTADRLFVNWCGSRNRDVGKVNVAQLGQLASRYMEVDLATLQEELLESHASLWSADQRKRMKR
jgi:hypothetical protein